MVAALCLKVLSKSVCWEREKEGDTVKERKQEGTWLGCLAGLCVLCRSLEACLLDMRQFREARDKENKQMKKTIWLHADRCLFECSLEGILTEQHHDLTVTIAHLTRWEWYWGVNSTHEIFPSSSFWAKMTLVKRWALKRNQRWQKMLWMLKTESLMSTVKDLCYAWTSRIVQIDWFLAVWLFT